MGSTSAAKPPAPPRLAIYQPLLDRLDEAALTPIVRRALRHRGAVPVSWRWAPVSYAAYYPRRLLVRVKGEADVRGRAVPWAAVIKIVEPPDADETIPGAARPATWDREVRAYRSGLLAHLPGGVAAPRVLRVDTFPSGAVWLWLECVHDACGGQWPLAQYGVAAHHLGRFNGAYLNQVPSAKCQVQSEEVGGSPRAVGRGARPMPAFRWLNRRWAESHSEPARLPAARQEIGELLAHPHVRATLPDATAGRVRRLLDDQPFFMDVLARLPQTLCHHDASSANLFARPRTAPGAAVDEAEAWETVAIDWEDIGPGPVGAEVATLVFGTMRRGDFPAQRALELEHIVLERYERGLRDAGWRGVPEVVRLGYAAAVALRWFLVPATLRLLVDPTILAPAERAARQAMPSLVPHRLSLLRFLLDRADEARSLARSNVLAGPGLSAATLVTQ